MRLHRVRFTVQGLMVAVAVAALLLGGGLEVARLRDFSAGYRARAKAAASGEEFCRSVLAKGGRGAVIWRVRADYFSTLRQNYEYVSRYPWLTVPPDPPEPPDDARISRLD